MTKLNVVVNVEVEDVINELGFDQDKSLAIISMIDDHVADWLFTEKIVIHFLNLLKQSECCEDDVFSPDVGEILKNWRITND